MNELRPSICDISGLKKGIEDRCEQVLENSLKLSVPLIFEPDNISQVIIQK